MRSRSNASARRVAPVELGINTMKGWTIRRRIVTSFAVIVALMAMMGTVAYARLVRVGQLARPRSRRSNRSSSRVKAIDGLNQAPTSMRNGVSRFNLAA
jgi:CHASE3 domain sensor protein